MIFCVDCPGIKCGSCEGNHRFHPQHENYSAASSPSSRIILLCPHPTAELFCSVPPLPIKNPKEIQKSVNYFFLNCFLSHLRRKTKNVTPNCSRVESSRVSFPSSRIILLCPSPTAKFFCCLPPSPSQQKKTRLQKSVIYFESEGLGQDTTELFCCDFPQEQNYSAVDSAVSFPNLSEISDFFYPELVLFPLR